MKQENSNIGKSDLLSLNIDEMVQDINERKTSVESAEPTFEEDQNENIPIDLQGENAFYPMQEDNGMWNTFMDNCKEYAYRVKKAGRKSYWIDEDIVNTLKSCDINKMAVADMINAVLRSFIELNKDNLRQFVEKKETLI